MVVDAGVERGGELEWEFAMRRQAVAEWRDRHILLVHASINIKAQEALQAFEEQAARASVVDSVWDPAGFANARIDGLMRERIEPLLQELMAGAEKELMSASESFADLGSALARSDALILPSSADPDTTPLPPTPGAAGTEVEGNDTQISWLKKLPSIAAERASSLAKHASETAEWIVQDKVGMRDRLRVAAANRIATTWMGGTGDPKPVLAQAITLIDEVAHQARTSLL